jgi:hypothetical protein
MTPFTSQSCKSYHVKYTSVSRLIDFPSGAKTIVSSLYVENELKKWKLGETV